jgi:hypothetical protein
MAVIYSYPVKSTPELTDKMLISDGTDNLTKQVTISGVKDTIDVVDSLAATLPIEVSASSGAVTVSSRAYAGAGTTGYVPTGGSATTFLRGDGNWVTPSGSGSTQPGNPSASVQYNDGAGAFAGSADLTFSTNTLAVKHTVDIKGQGQNLPAGKLKLNCELGSHAVTIEGPLHNNSGGSYTLKLPSLLPQNNQILQFTSSGNLGWINTPTGSGGVSSFTNTNGTFISAGTANSSATGAVTMGTIDLSATGTASSTTFLRGDNTWATPTGGGISFSGTTANGIATYSSATTANVSSNLTIDNTSKKLSIGSTYSIQDLSGAFNIGSLSSTQAQENIAFYINGSEKVRIDEDGRLVSSAGSAANPNLKFGTGNDGIYGTSNTVQIVTNGTSKISVADGNTADIQMNDLVEFGYGLRFGGSGSTLSTYTEATWTSGPTLTFSFGGAATLSASAGSYRVIGDMVFAQFQFTFSSGGYGTADLSLPVSGVAGTGSINFAKMNSSLGNSTVSTPVTGDILTNAASIRLQSFNYDQDSGSHVSGQLFELAATSGQPVFQSGDVVSGTIIYRKS